MSPGNSSLLHVLPTKSRRSVNWFNTVESVIIILREICVWYSVVLQTLKTLSGRDCCDCSVRKKICLLNTQKTWWWIFFGSFMLWPEVIIPKIATLSKGPEPRPSCIIFCFTSHPCASCYHHFCLHQWVPPLDDVIVESSLLYRWNIFTKKLILCIYT